MKLATKSTAKLWEILEDIWDMQAGRESAYLEFKYGEDVMNRPTAEQLREARQVVGNHREQIGDIKAEIERREPGTFISF